MLVYVSLKKYIETKILSDFLPKSHAFEGWNEDKSKKRKFSSLVSKMTKKNNEQ